MNKKKIVWAVFLILVLAACVIVMVLAQEKPPERERDKAFVDGSRIRIEQVSNLQLDSLYKLCKVWGFAKYHHPSVVDGTLNWDAELFRVIPKVLEARNEASANEAMVLWLSQFPFEPERTEDAEIWLTFQEELGFQDLDTMWIRDTGTYGEDLCGYLEKLSQTCLTDRENAYAAFTKDSAFVNFENESMWPLKPEDDGMKLLALFRFWNMYEYYSPNVQITKKDWNLVLQEAIPEIISADTYRDYVLAIAGVAAETGDAHITVLDKEYICWYYFGTRFVPCSVKDVGGQMVVSQVAADVQELQTGDIILAIDGQLIEDRVTELSSYVALPEPDKYMEKMGTQLLETENEKAEVQVIRGNDCLTLQVETMEQQYHDKNPYDNGLIGQGEIGYIDPSRLKEGQLEKLMEEFADTKGIIVDLRYYPSIFLPYLLGEYIIPEPTQFAVMTFPNRVRPGSFFRSDNLLTGAGVMNTMGDDRTFPPYHGKVILLMDEGSMSQSEFTIMALRQSPNATVVGSPSIGADGNIVKLSLPGNITMNFTGLGVYTPEGKQTQRVGLEPDVLCRPTVDGLRAGRDELMEKAAELILE